MLKFELLHPKMNIEHLGLLPEFFSETDPRSAAEQLDENYAHGGGFRPSPENTWALDRETLVLTYPEEPPMQPLAKAYLHDELLVFYPSAFLAIIQPDGSFKVTRVD
jgi:hypothetical protein